MGPWNIIYFVVLILFGGFYLINLMLAVVSMSYEEEAVRAGRVISILFLCPESLVQKPIFYQIWNTLLADLFTHEFRLLKA